MPAENSTARPYIGLMLRYTSHELRRAMDQYMAERVAPELTGVRGMVLGEICCANDQGRDLYQRDLEEWLHIGRSSITTLLQGMEQDGFIRRESVAQDARFKRLCATEKGRACCDDLQTAMSVFEAQLCEGLTRAQLEQVQQCLGVLLQNAHNMAQRSSQPPAP